MYYYQPSKGPLSPYSHIRSATSPAAIRRMSIDRGASRYRALSVAASNVAAAAALAAQQEELPDSRRRYAHNSNRRRTNEGSTPRAQGLDDAEEYYEEDVPSAMFSSFHSEGGRDYRSKRVSWSIERHAGRASSMGRNDRPATPTVLEIIGDNIPDQTSNERELQASHRDRDHTLMESSESLTQSANSRSNRASRKGSTMVFLGVWALFGIGAMTNGRRGFPSQKLTSIGHVMSNYDSFSRSSVTPPLPNDALHSRHNTDGDNFVRLDFSNFNLNPEDTPHEDPSSQQILGRVFAWLCTTLYLTSRLPQIWKNVSFGQQYFFEHGLTVIQVYQKISRGWFSHSSAESMCLIEGRAFLCTCSYLRFWGMCSMWRLSSHPRDVLLLPQSPRSISKKAYRESLFEIYLPYLWCFGI